MSDIERLLRQDARIELPDEGFAARVMGVALLVAWKIESKPRG